MEHKIELISCEMVKNTTHSFGTVREALLNIDGISITVIAKYYRHLGGRSYYKLSCSNKMLTKHPDYKKMRDEILLLLHNQARTNQTLDYMNMNAALRGYAKDEDKLEAARRKFNLDR